MHESLEFLEKFRPNGPWLLVAIEPDGKKKGVFPEGRTFTADKTAEMEKWITNQNRTKNIYFSVNPTLEPLNKKPLRTDISQVEYLHVDVDPEAGEDLQKEQDRILGKFREFKPVPTCVIFSGGGYQGFWKLQEPLPVNGELSLAEDHKRYNIQLEMLFKGDNCHNVDRIMRVPGTMNRPDDKKKKKGRIPVLAKVVHLDPTIQYPINSFTAAQPVQNARAGRKGILGASVVLPEISGNVERLTDEEIQDLPVKTRIKLLIVHGKDPDNPEKYSSRSEALFSVCCALVRANVANETIYSIITDPNLRIADSVLEQGARSEAYAIKQIKSALEHVEDPALRELNEKHAVIGSIGGKCRIISREWDPAFERTKIVRQSAADLRLRYMNRNVVVGKNKNGEDQTMPLGEWWLRHPKREEFTSMIFLPEKETPGIFNLWQGFTCEAIPGKCNLFLDHIKYNICKGNDYYYEYLIKWMASVVQKPSEPGRTAVVLRGRQGTGKGVFAKHFGHLLGQHFLQITNAKHLTGSFNNHLRDCILLFADEAFYAGDNKGAQILKGLITEEQLMVEPKGVDAEFARNYLHIVMASNSDWVVPVELDDRRFFVLDVGDEHKEDHAYFSAIRRQLKDEGGYEALLYYLKTYDISGFSNEAAPKTEALHHQKTLNLSPEDAWWFDKLQEGRIMPCHSEWFHEISKEDLYLEFLDFVHKQKIPSWGVAKLTKYRLSNYLIRICPLGFPRQIRRNIQPQDGSRAAFSAVAGNDKPVFYVFPSLVECRKAWETKMGPTEWQAVEDEDKPIIF